MRGPPGGYEQQTYTHRETGVGYFMHSGGKLQATELIRQTNSQNYNEQPPSSDAEVHEAWLRTGLLPG